MTDFPEILGVCNMDERFENKANLALLSAEND